MLLLFSYGLFDSDWSLLFGVAAWFKLDWDRVVLEFLNDGVGDGDNDDIESAFDEQLRELLVQLEIKGILFF